MALHATRPTWWRRPPVLTVPQMEARRLRWPVPRCPRCRGRLFREWDPDTGREWACINCGWRRGNGEKATA